jgi:PAS domain S-box-containing protein
MKPRISLHQRHYFGTLFLLLAGVLASCSNVPNFTNSASGSVAGITPYLATGAAAAFLLIAILVIFNLTLQRRLKARVREFEKKLAELKTSETHFREALEHLPIPISIADDKGNIIELNREFVQRFGYTVRDITSITSWMLQAYPNPEQRGKIIAQLNGDVLDAMREQKTTPLREYKLIGKDGREHDVEIIMRTVGNLSITSFVEITERKKAENALRESRKFLAELIEYSEAVILVKDIKGRYELVNHKYEEVMGLKREDVIGHTAEELFPEPIGKEFHANDIKVIESGKAVEVEEALDGPNGRRYFLSIKFPLLDENGNIRGMCGIATEITGHKRAETALREAETKYRALVEHAPEVIYLDGTDEASSSVYISSQVERLLGYSSADFAADPQLWHSLIHPYDYQRAVGSIERTLVHGGAVEEYRMIKRDGSVIWVRDTSVSITNETGENIFIQGFLQDITERKFVEEKLLESEKRYRTLFEESPIALLEEDFSGVKLFIDNLRNAGIKDLRAYFKENPQAAKQCADMAQIVNVNKAAVIWYQAKTKAEMQTSLSQLIGANGQERFFEEILALIEGDNRYEIAISRLGSKNQPVHLILTGALMPGCEATWERVLVSILDITKSKLAEEELARQNERLRSLRAIDQSIVNNLDMDTNLKVLIEEIVKQLDVDAAIISLLKGQTLRFAAGQGIRTDGLKFMHMNIGEGLAGRVARERNNVYIRNLQEADYHPTLARALQAEGFIAYYGTPLISKDKVLGVLEIFHRSPLANDSDWLAFLDTLARQAAISIDSVSLFNDLRISNAELYAAYDSTLEGWSRALDLRDKETEGHTRRVTELTLRLAGKFGFSREQIVHIKRGSLLHDIGKMGIPDAILLKPGELNAAEQQIMRQHPNYAHTMLSPIQYLQPAIDIPYCHHEQWDGMGYPRGLKGQDIPLAARIFTVVDVWDALTSNRPYHAAWSQEKAKDYLRTGAGKQFDPRIVDTFLEMLENEKA